MWQVLAISLAAYTILTLLVLSMARAAKAADRSERLVFRAWLDERQGRVIEHPVLRSGRKPKVA